MSALYVAAPYAHKTDARNVAFTARAVGFSIASTWHDQPNEDEDTLSEERRAAIVRVLVSELARADVLVALTAEGRPRSTLVEVGIAIGLGKPVVFLQDGMRGRLLFDSH